MKKFNNGQPRISIIILNWNGWQDTIECLESLYQIKYKNYNVILVENGSTDNSLKKIYDYCNGREIPFSDYIEFNSKNKPISIFKIDEKELEEIRIPKNFLSQPVNKRLFLIHLENNKGFTGGNNIAMKFSLNHLKPDYIFLLNNDVVVEKNFLNELIKVGERKKKIGILGPEIRYYNKPNEIQFSERFQNIEKPQDVDWVSGCAFLAKTELIRKIGLLDPIFQNYFEETDFIERARNKGYTVYYVPTQHKIFHKLSACNRKIPGYITYYMTRNFMIYTKKHSDKLDFFIKIKNFAKQEIKSSLNSRKILYVIKGLIRGFIQSFNR